ncbi:DUF2497 domain-containing protein [Ancylobacter pratisalsi]|nr:DUF2497 domain-containing protein [Ancylobacter pratisalsi]
MRGSARSISAGGGTAGRPRSAEAAARSYAPSAARAGQAVAGQAYSSYVPAGRVPASDPFAARSRALGSAQPAESPMATSSVALASAMAVPADRGGEPDADEVKANEASANEALDLDRPFTSALIDLALVEQAVQAELATVAEEAEASVQAHAAAQESRDAAVLDALARDMASQEAAVTPDSLEAESAAADGFEARTTTEAADMQVNAKPTAVQRPAAEHAEERRPMEARPVDARSPETRAVEAGAPFPRTSEPRLSAPLRTAQEAGPVAPLDPVRERLVSGATNSAVSAAFGSLARTVASNSRTVDDLVAEAIRPMLKDWLDENLPTLVERLVRAEIERVARQGQ